MPCLLVTPRREVARLHHRSLRVLMVSDVFHPRVNGVSTSIETFRVALEAFDIDIRLVVPRYGDEPEEAGITRVPGWPVPGDPEDRVVRWGAMRTAVRDAASDCDMIHIQTPFMAHYAGLAAARAHRLPSLLTYHTFFEEYLHHYAPMVPRGALKAVARHFSRTQCNSVDAVIVPSTAMRERLVGYGVTRPLNVLPTGIRTTAFTGGNRARFRMQWGIAPDAPLALFVGRVAHEKNIGFLIDVAAKVAPILPGFTLLIAGEGPALPALRADVARRGLGAHLRFVGYLERQSDLPDCYAAADAFVFASKTETQGLVLLEAMAAGLPVIALSEMGTRDILDGARGCRIAPEQVGKFAEVLLDVLTDATARRILGQEARAHSRAWEDSRQAELLAALYRRLATERGEVGAGSGASISA